MNDNIKIVVNSLLAGALVTLGAMADGSMEWETIYYAIVAGAIIAVTQIKEKLIYIKNKQGEMRLFSLI